MAIAMSEVKAKEAAGEKVIKILTMTQLSLLDEDSQKAALALAEKEGNRILSEIHSKHDIIAARCVHRTGHLQIGEIAICIAVAAAHREAAFSACSAIIDAIKSTVPIWKKEHYTNGSAEWVKCDSCSGNAIHHQH